MNFRSMFIQPHWNHFSKIATCTTAIGNVAAATQLVDDCSFFTRAVQTYVTLVDLEEC